MLLTTAVNQRGYLRRLTAADTIGRAARCNKVLTSQARRVAAMHNFVVRRQCGLRAVGERYERRSVVLGDDRRFDAARLRLHLTVRRRRMRATDRRRMTQKPATIHAVLLAQEERHDAQQQHGDAESREDH